MENENQHIYLDKEQKEVIIRHGEAQVIRDPKIVDIIGVLNAPRTFYEKRKSEHAKLACHVLYSRSNREIRLILDERAYFNTQILGKLNVAPELREYGINGSCSTSTSQDLMKFLRMRSMHFADKDKAKEIVNNLAKFKASVQVEIESADNQRGDLIKKFEQKVKSDIPLDFELEMVIFKGMPKKKFKVEIMFAINNATAELWLESPQLNEIMDVMLNKAIDDELKAFKDIVVIEQ